MVKTWTLYVKHYIIPFTYPYHIFLSFQPPQLNSQGKDRYNKKLKKYYVVYEENDTELSEDEEKEEKKDTEAPYMTCLLWKSHTNAV